MWTITYIDLNSATTAKKVKTFKNWSAMNRFVAKANIAVVRSA